jgi:GT2 family glycosyltransferase
MQVDASHDTGATSCGLLTAAPSSRPAVAIVLLTWNGTADTVACLRSLCPQLAGDDQVLVVDNGSADDVAAAVRSLDPRIQFVANGRNLGFAGGNNVGLRLALAGSAAWIFVLNNDTVLESGALDALMVGAENLRRTCPAIGVVQPVLVRADAPDIVDSCGQELGERPRARDLAAGRAVATVPTAPVEIFGACGAATLVHRDALQAAGLFDEGLFVLFEDTDLAFRLRAAGCRAALLPLVRVRHKRGVSAGSRSVSAAQQRKFWVQRNIVTLALRWWPAGALLRSAPVLVWRALQALLLRRGPCLRLWLRSLRARRETRRQLRAAGGDAWFGATFRELRLDVRA